MPGARRGHRRHGTGRFGVAQPGSPPPPVSRTCSCPTERATIPAMAQPTGPDDPGAALDPARRAAGRPRPRLDARRHARTRSLPLPDGVGDRLSAQPLVRDLQRMRLPRGLAVALVFLVFASAVVFVALAARRRSWSTRHDLRADASTTTSRSKDANGRTGAEQDIDRLQLWLDTSRARAHQDPEALTDWADNLEAEARSRATRRTRFRSRKGAADVDRRRRSSA